MFATVRRYTYNPQDAGQINHLVREKVVPTLRHLPGFVAYYWVDSGAGAGASWLVFEAEAYATASLDKACEMMQAPIGSLLRPAQTTQGQVIAFTNAGL